MPGEEQRYQELRQDIKDSITEVKDAIHDLRAELRTDYVGRGEYETALFAVRKDITDIKESSRWTASQILVVLSSLSTAGVSLIVALIR